MALSCDHFDDHAQRLVKLLGAPGNMPKTIGEKLPKGFQRAEFVLDHGFVDQVVPRAQLRDRVAYFLTAFRPR